MAKQEIKPQADAAMPAIVKGLTVGLLQENCYIFGCAKTHKAVVIDPGDNARAILKVVRDSGLTLERIINTHAHFDHVMAVNAIRATAGIPFCLHKDDLQILRDVPSRVRLWLVTFTVKPFWRRCSAHSMHVRQTVGVNTSTGANAGGSAMPSADSRVRSRKTSFLSMAFQPCSP